MNSLGTALTVINVESVSILRADSVATDEGLGSVGASYRYYGIEW
jgi:hypothetical protein